MQERSQQQVSSLRELYRVR